MEWGRQTSESNLDSSVIRTNTSALNTEDRARVSELESKVKALEQSLREYQVCMHIGMLVL